MASNSLISAVSRLSSMIANIQGRIDAIDAGNKQSSNDPQILTKIAEIDNMLRDVRLSQAQGKDDLSKERSLIESSIMFKVEQYVNRSIKERMDIMNISIDDKLRRADIEARIDQAVKKCVQDVSLCANDNENAQDPTPLIKSLDDKLNLLEARLNDISKKLLTIDDRMNTTTKDVGLRMASVESRIKSVENNSSVPTIFESRFKALETLISTIEGKIKANEEGCSSTKKSGSTTETQVTEQPPENSEFMQARRKIARGRGK